MLVTLHRVKDNQEVIINSDFFLFASQYKDYLEVVLLSDECFEVKETLKEFLDLLHGKKIETKKEVIIDAISKDIKKKPDNVQKRFRRYSKNSKRTMKRPSKW